MTVEKEALRKDEFQVDSAEATVMKTRAIAGIRCGSVAGFELLINPCSLSLEQKILWFSNSIVGGKSGGEIQKSLQVP